eukprot:2266593-Alexandrium_andersonii.AAC.1
MELFGWASPSSRSASEDADAMATPRDGILKGSLKDTPWSALVSLPGVSAPPDAPAPPRIACGVPAGPFVSKFSIRVKKRRRAHPSGASGFQLLRLLLGRRCSSLERLEQLCISWVGAL